MIDPQTSVDDKTLAILAGVSARRVRQLAEAGILERIGPGRYRLDDAVQALLAHAAGSGSAMNQAKVKKLAAQAEKAELELAKAKAEVAPIREIEKTWTRMLATIRANVLTVPTRAVIQLLGETDETVFKRVLKEELTQALVAAETMQHEEVEG